MLWASVRSLRLDQSTSNFAEWSNHEVQGPIRPGDRHHDAQKGGSFETQSESAKSIKATIISQIVRLVRKAGLDYEGWRYVTKRVRKRVSFDPAKKGRKLPRILNADDFRKFYAEVDKADDAQHSLMLRLLFFTGVRVSELCNMLVADVDLESVQDPDQPGQGSKDRYVLFGKGFGTALRTHIAAHGSNRYLFQTRRNSKYTPRRVQQIVKTVRGEGRREGHAAHLPASGDHLADAAQRPRDAELQLITGHARRETLAVYQHVALDGDLEQKYQEAMRDVGL